MALFRGLDPKTQIAKIYRPSIWRGMAPDRPPQSLGENQPFLAINTRINGGLHSQRSGMRDLVNLGGKITGITTHVIGAARSLFITGDGCPSVSPGAGSYLGVVDQDLKSGLIFDDGSLYGNPEYTAYRNATYYDAVTYPVVAAAFGGDLFFGADNVLKRFSAQNSLQETRLNLPSAYVAVSAAIEHEGTLLLGLIGSTASGVGTSAVFTFDGVTLTNVLTAINVVRGFGIYRDMAVAIFDGTPNSIRVRSAAGVWSAAIPPSAGTVKIDGSNCVSFQDKLYIPGGDEDLFAFDQTSTLTRIPRATNLIDAGGHIMGVEKMADANGVQTLYFVWHNSALTAVYIGSFDGTTWTPKVKSLTSQATWPAVAKDYWAGRYPTQYPPGISRCIRQYRGSLWVAGIQTGPGIAALYASPRATISGTWQRLIPSVTYSNSDISQMLVF